MKYYSAYKNYIKKKKTFKNWGENFCLQFSKFLNRKTGDFVIKYLQTHYSDLE